MTTTRKKRHYWDVSDVHLTRRIQRVGRPGGNHRRRKHRHNGHHGCTYTQGFCLRLKNRTFIWYWRKA